MFRSARALAPLVRAERCTPLLGLGALASAAVLERDRRQKCARCETDWITPAIVVVGGAAVVGGAILLAGKEKKKTFAQKLEGQYRSSESAVRTLADVKYAHPDLVQAGAAEARVRDDLRGSTATVLTANRIREIWAQLLAEICNVPKEMFMQSRKHKNRGSTARVGAYTIPIAKLKTNAYARSFRLDELAKALDRDESGTLDFHEFATLVLILAEFYEAGVDARGRDVMTKPRAKKRPKREVLRLFYSILDDNADGSVVREEFESFCLMMAALGLVQQAALPELASDSLWARFDANGDGLLSYEEFCAFAKDMLDLSAFPGNWP